MAEKGKQKNTPNIDGNEGESEQKMLYRHLLEPTDERLPEFTDLPLQQITPLTWMATYDAVFRESVEYVKYAIALRKYKRLLKNGGPKMKAPKPPKPVSPSEEWRKMYYKHRRSLSGANAMAVAVLAGKQLEVQQENLSPDQMGSIPRD